MSGVFATNIPRLLVQLCDGDVMQCIKTSIALLGHVRNPLYHTTMHVIIFAHAYPVPVFV